MKKIGPLWICAVLFLAGASALTLPSRSAQAFDWLGRIKMDAEGLDSEDPGLRGAAIVALARYDIEWTRSYLLRALGDENPEVQIAAARQLAGHPDKHIVRIITEWLSSPDKRIRQTAATVLGTMQSEAAVPALVRALGDADPQVRTSSVLALGKIGGSTVILPLVSVLEDPKSEVRLEAVKQLQALRDARAMIPLVGRFRDSNRAIRLAAIRAVGKVGSPDAVPPLLRELASRSPQVSIAAIKALGDLASPLALPKLVSLLASRNPVQRRRDAALSVARIVAAHPLADNAQSAISLLVNSLDDAGISGASQEALRVVGPLALKPLVASLDDATRIDAAKVVGLLIELRDHDATPALLRELARGRLKQALILKGLSDLGDSRALLPMLSLLDNPNAEVRILAMKSLAPLLSEPSAAADIVAEHLVDPNSTMRELAARYLGTMGATSGVPALLAAAKASKSNEFRRTALRALGKIGDTRATPWALLVLQTGPPNLALAAADALAEMADESAIAPLLKIVSERHHPAKLLALEALGATLRGKSNDGVIHLALALTKSRDTPQFLVAIEALAEMTDARIGPRLLALLSQGNAERRHAIVVALGAQRYRPAASALALMLRNQTQKTAGAAAWALGEIGAHSARQALIEARAGAQVAVAVNASAALARMATPADLGGGCISSEQHRVDSEGSVLSNSCETKRSKNLASDLFNTKILEQATPFLKHGNPLIRVNTLALLARLKAPGQLKNIEALLARDPSVLVRVAAIRALSMLGGGTKAVAKASNEDASPEVRAAALTSLQHKFVPATATDWSVFRVVDPADAERPLSEARFFVGANGIAWVRYSDSRGRIYDPHFPEGTFWQAPLANLRGY